MSGKKSFGRGGVPSSLSILVGACTGILYQTLKIIDHPKYISEAKLFAYTKTAASEEDLNIRFHQADHYPGFFGSIIETVESAEMRRRAVDRVRALHPDVTEADVEITASKQSGSTIAINLYAFGADPKFTRLLLDALLDEYLAFRNQIREQQRNKALTALAEDVVRREKALQNKQEKLGAFERANNAPLLVAENTRLIARLTKLKNERDDLASKSQEDTVDKTLKRQLALVESEITRTKEEVIRIGALIAEHDLLSKQQHDAKRAFDEILDFVRQLTVEEEMASDHVVIMERASPPVESIQDWIMPIITGALIGAGGGLALSLLLVLLIHSMRRPTNITLAPGA